MNLNIISYIVLLLGLSFIPGRLAAENEIPSSTVVLGSSDVVSGVPGSGSVSLAEIESWLADPANHAPLRPKLPWHLRELQDQIVVPDSNPLTRAKIELGRQLFFDSRLGTFSCGACHQPRQRFTAFQVFPDTKLNPQVAFNRILGREHFWDGKSPSLEAQPLMPLTNPFEMNVSPDELEVTLENIEGYRVQFQKIFGEVSFSAYGKALASFQRTLVTGPSRYDYYRLLEEPARDVEQSSVDEAIVKRATAELQKSPLSDSELRGMALFFGERAGCANCHTGPNFTDEEFHNVGVGFEDDHPNLGRYKVTGEDADRGAFKTPTLRNVVHTPPYVHNGEFRRLEEVIDYFDRGGHPNSHLSSLIHPLGLSPQEKEDLLAFLGALDSPLPRVETGRLPE